MSECILIPTDHAFIRLEERGISWQEARDAIVRGSRTENPDGTFTARCGACVAVFKEKPCQYVLITVYPAGADEE